VVASGLAPKILSVDDTDANLFVVRQLLEPLGYEVVDASSGREALDLAAREEFALFLLDVMMPELDGIETLERLRATAKTASAPVILITAAGLDRARVERAYSLGAVDYLEKPIPAAVLRGKDKAMVALYESNRTLRAREASLVMKDRHIAILAHDLRTPLNTVMAAAHILQHATPTPAARIGSERILGAARRMSSMIKDLLEQARAGSGELPMSPVPMDVGVLCQELVADLGICHPARNIVLDVTGDGRGEWDRARLCQAVANLLENALEHGRGDVRLSVVDRGGKIEIAVSSEGRPISLERFTELVEPFRRDSAGGEGLGLGLYVVDLVARLHGGRLTVATSELGNTFVIELPRKQI
jgi:two-component system, sensor histidine kinase and response regulator